MDEKVVGEIRTLLSGLKGSERVSIPLAIESGSRAWGFPSPDSDYDCRFVFIRGVDETLRLFPKRDVIEAPLTAVLDVNGWELGKAIKLLLKGNAVIIEWLQSPFAYLRDDAFCAEMLALAGRVARRDAIAGHYLHLLYSMRDRVFADPEAVPLKKVFYAMRPAMALRWMRMRPDRTVAPMNFVALCGEADLPPDIGHEIEDLLKRKAETRELGSGPVHPALFDFIREEVEKSEAWIAKPGPPKAWQKADAEETYLGLLRKYGP